MGKAKLFLPLAALLLAACGNLSGPQPESFTLALNPMSLTVHQGANGTTQLTITPQNGFTGTVALSLVAGQDRVPQGLTLSPGSVQVSGFGPVNQPLTLSAQPTTPTGAYRLKVRATSGSLAREADLTVVVTPPSPDFTLSLNPWSLTVQQGAEGQTTLTVTPHDGFTGTVSLSLVGAPGGVTLSPTGVTVSGSGPVAQALTLSVDESVAPGTYPLQVQGTAGGHVRKANLNLTVTAAPPPFTGALDLPSPLQTVPPGGQLQVPVRVAFNGSRVASVTLTVRLADPCAKGTSNCPGWDASRYPGVAHPTGSHTLTPTSPSATLTFRVDPGAPPQGPFKYELVLSGREASGKVREEALPFYLKVLAPGERSGMEAWNFWRDYLGLPRVREDPEWSFRAWLHSRYAVMNYPNNLPHDEDLSQPFASPEGREAGRRGNEWRFFSGRNGQPYWPTEEASINGWIAAPFHRFNMIDPRAVNGGFGVYKDVGPVPGWGDGWGRSCANLPNLYGGSLGTRPQLFPAPDKPAPLNRYQGPEYPNPTAPCSNPSRPQVRPFLTQEGLTWDDGNGVVRDPIGLPITLQTFPSASVDTEVLDARLTRLSDGILNPLCAYGSLQYWEGQESWYQAAQRILRGRGAVVALPHQPLTPGEAYEAYLKVRLGSEVREFTWRFSVARESDLRPFRVAPSLELQEGR
jgi:hypothetical protein